MTHAQPSRQPWWHGAAPDSRAAMELLPFCKRLCCLLLLLSSRGLSPALTLAGGCGTPSREQGLGETHGSEVGCPPPAGGTAGCRHCTAPHSPMALLLQTRLHFSFMFCFSYPNPEQEQKSTRNLPNLGALRRACLKEPPQGHGAAQETPSAPRGRIGVRSRCVSPAFLPADVAALPPPCRGLPPRPAPGCD